MCDQGNFEDYPHRGFMDSLDGYATISGIIRRMQGSGITTSYEELYVGIVEDPCVISISGQCRLIDFRTDVAKNVFRFISSFSDSTVIVRRNGVEYVSILELFFEYRNDLQGLGIYNQFELMLLFRHFGVRLNEDMVDILSLSEICRDIVPPLMDEEDSDVYIDDLMDIDDGDDPVALIVEYVKLFNGDMVPWGLISRNLYYSNDRLSSLKSTLMKIAGISVSDQGVSFSETNNFVTGTEVQRSILIDERISSLIMEIFSTGRRYSVSGLQKILSSRHGLDLDGVTLSDHLYSMVRCGGLVRETPKTYRVFKSEYNLDDVRRVLSVNHDCVYHYEKLYSKDSAIWKSIGIYDSLELLMIIQKHNLATIVSDELVSFDGATVKTMLENMTISKDELRIKYGLRGRYLSPKC